MIPDAAAPAGQRLTIAHLRFTPPRLTLPELVDIVATLYGVTGTCEPLEGERDQNTSVTTADGRRYVLKISGAAEDPEVVDFQVQALLHIELQDPGLPVPRLIRGRGGEAVHWLERESGRHAVRLVGFLPGILYQDGPFPSRAGLAGVGAFLARLGQALHGFAHRASGHFMPWNIAGGLVFEPQLRGLLPAPLAAELAEPLERIERDVWPRLAHLRAQVIHQDAHGANLLRAGPGSEQVAGIIDFGDMIHAPLVCDLAACASDFISSCCSGVASLTTVASSANTAVLKSMAAPIVIPMSVVIFIAPSLIVKNGHGHWLLAMTGEQTLAPAFNLHTAP